MCADLKMLSENKMTEIPIESLHTLVLFFDSKFSYTFWICPYIIDV